MNESVDGTNDDENQMLVVDNDKIRYVYGLRCYMHITEYRDKMNALRANSQVAFRNSYS